MEKKEIYLTPEGAGKLRQELEGLRGPRRAALAARLRHAVQQGDLTENADYLAAKEEQAFLEGKIQELEEILRQAVIVEPSGSKDRVAIGSTVVVMVDGKGPQTFQVVGSKEADPRSGRISHESPIGRALLDRRPGDRVTADTPAGPLEIKVVEVR
jgi:transcription elongation factor GreA